LALAKNYHINGIFWLWLQLCNLLACHTVWPLAYQAGEKFQPTVGGENDMGKYPDWTREQTEALLNRLGGVNRAQRFLCGDGQPGSDLLRALEAAGYSEADIARLLRDDLLANLLPVVRGKAVVMEGHIIDCDADPFLPDGWKSVESNRKHGQLLWSPDKVELWLSQEQHRDDKIVDRYLWDKLLEQSLLNANVLDYLLKHPYLIPKEWRGKWVYFWGTVYLDRSSSLSVRCLKLKHRGQCLWDYNWIKEYFGGNDPAAVLCE
jgi:hypothetical protein